MKYRLIAPIHYLRISSVLNKGILLWNNVRISNNNKYIENLMDTTDIYEYIGAVGYQELKESTYVYAEGHFSSLIEMYGEQKFPINYAFIFLRETDGFLANLWCVEDHNVYVRDGYLHIYDSDPKDGKVHRASISCVDPERIMHLFY